MKNAVIFFLFTYLVFHFFDPIKLLFDYENAQAFDRLMTQQFDKHSIVLDSLSCHMYEHSRVGYCVFHASLAEFSKIKEAFHAQILPRDLLPAYDRFSHPCTNAGWKWDYAHDGAIISYQAGPEFKRIDKTSTSLDHLFYKPESEEGCIDIATHFG